MSNDDEPTTVRDLKIMWRSGIFVALIAAGAIGSILTAVVWAVRHDARLETVEKWQAARDADARRELWRRERNPVPPKS